MKVIDLLNKIANGEIHYSRKFRFPYEEYCTATQFFERYNVDKEILNLEIKELEDTPKDKKINRVEREARNLTNLYIKSKLNEIIDRLNGEDNE